jgi:hypothetical protein
MEGNVEVQNASASMFDNEETVQRPGIKVGNGEEVECGKRFTMIVQKGAPSASFAFVRNALQPLQTTRYSRFGDLEAKQ